MEFPEQTGKHYCEWPTDTDEECGARAISKHGGRWLCSHHIEFVERVLEIIKDDYDFD